ncbi:MAG: hypothetical protein M1820_000459 [Bogoriella megaspora]|nr:MAG: hypothetical protein M1820_000459 [Bogoriella megaspora]
MRRLPRKFTVPSDDRLVEIHLEAPVVSAQNLVLEAWSSSHILSQNLNKITPDVEAAIALLQKRDTPSAESSGKNTPQSNGSMESTHPEALSIGGLELGAGLGLVGLAAAAIWGTQITMTDLPPLVPPIIANIKLNAGTLASNGGSAVAGALDWDKPNELTFHDGKTSHVLRASGLPSEKKSKIILAADVIYDENHPRILTDAILTWLSQVEESRAIVAYPLRIAYLDAIRDFWERMERGGLVAVREGRAKAGEDWDDEEEIEWCIWKWKKFG